LKFLAFMIVGFVAFGLVVMFLWNALVPQLFNGPSISFWQGIGLLLLSHILLRGWGRWHYGNGWRRERWRRRLEERMAGMTPEEREKFKQEWDSRCGWGHAQANTSEGKA
jgi:hypothetical protein